MKRVYAECKVKQTKIVVSTDQKRLELKTEGLACFDRRNLQMRVGDIA
jgi:hypothetical protein